MTVARTVEARRWAIEALSADGAEPGASTDDLDAAGDALEVTVAAGDPGVSAVTIRAYAEALRCLAALERWEADTLTATAHAERHRRSAELRAKRAADTLAAEDPLQGPLHTVLSAIAAADWPEAHRVLRAAVLTVALPVPLIEPGRTTAPPAPTAGEPPDPAPRGVLITLIAGAAAIYSQAVRPGRVHDLEVEARLLDWPEEYEHLVVRFVSRWPKAALEIPEVTISRPADPSGDVWIGRGAGHVLLSAGAADPRTAIEVALNAELVGSDSSQPLVVLGQSEIALRTYDPSFDVFTSAPVVDQRILDMLSEVRELEIAPDEQPALGRFFGAIARAGVRMITERQFPAGSNVDEREFQAELLKRLGMAPELGGRVTEHAWQAGGPTDLVHDGVVAELKVERTAPVTLEDASRYLGQATQYASGGQRQLSILAILDMTPAEAPPGVLANSIGWLVPKLHGLDDPAFPSRVAVIVIKANLPRPSDWSK